MDDIKIYPASVIDRLDAVVQLSWDFFVNHFINQKYDITVEAPFKLHFASVIKHVAELFCFAKYDAFAINLEAPMDLNGNKNHVDVVLSFLDRNTDVEYSVPIELKFKTERQSAEDIGSLEIYKDIHNLELLVLANQANTRVIPFSYFFCITDNGRYVKPVNRGLKTVFATHDGAIIATGTDYVYVQNQTGKDFYTKNCSLIFRVEHHFEWQAYTSPNSSSVWFLAMRIFNTSV